MLYPNPRKTEEFLSNYFAPMRPEGFVPGLDFELQELVDAFIAYREKAVKDMEKKAGSNPKNRKDK